MFDTLMQEIFARTISRRSPELCRKVHAGQACDLGQVGKTDATVKMRFDVYLDAPETPFRQGVDPGSREFEPGQMHCERLTDATCKLFVGRIAVLGQRLCKLLGERIAQQDQVVNACDRHELPRRSLRRKVIRRNVKVQEVVRCMKLRTELLRWRRNIQRARRHDAVEYGLPSAGQLQARDFQGDADEVSIGRCCRFLVSRSILQVPPARDRDVLDRGANATLELAPFAFTMKRLRPVRNLLLLWSVLEINPGAARLRDGKHRSFLLSSLPLRRPLNPRIQPVRRQEDTSDKGMELVIDA